MAESKVLKTGSWNGMQIVCADNNDLYKLMEILDRATRVDCEWDGSEQVAVAKGHFKYSIEKHEVITETEFKARKQAREDAKKAESGEEA